MAGKIRESLDTNIILRMILQDVPEQCLKVVDLMMRHGVVYRVEPLAITEAVFTLQKSYCWPRSSIVAAMQEFLQEFVGEYNHELFERVFPMYLDCPKLSFNDCCLAAYAALNEAEPLWTFDRALAKQSGVAKLLE